MKSLDERLSNVIDKLTNENAELKAENESYRTAIAFETTCLNCARITERLAYAESIIAELKQLTKEDNE